MAVLVMVAAGCGSGSTSPSSSAPAPDTVAAPAAPEADYTGTGTKIIGSVDLPNGATAEWTSDGAIFFLIALEGPASIANPQLIVSQESGGTGEIPAGHYVFKVSTDSAANWTLTFSEH
jgi:uncharacterized protein YceK